MQAAWTSSRDGLYTYLSWSVGLQATGFGVGFGVVLGLTTAGDAVAAEPDDPAAGVAPAVAGTKPREAAAPWVVPPSDVAAKVPGVLIACGRSAPTTESTTNVKTRTARTSRLDGDSGFRRIPPPSGRVKSCGGVRDELICPPCTVHVCRRLALGVWRKQWPSEIATTRLLNATRWPGN